MSPARALTLQGRQDTAEDTWSDSCVVAGCWDASDGPRAADTWLLTQD